MKNVVHLGDPEEMGSCRILKSGNAVVVWVMAGCVEVDVEVDV